MILFQVLIIENKINKKKTLPTITRVSLRAEHEQ